MRLEGEGERLGQVCMAPLLEIPHVVQHGVARTNSPELLESGQRQITQTLRLNVLDVEAAKQRVSEGALKKSLAEVKENLSAATAQIKTLTSDLSARESRTKVGWVTGTAHTNGRDSIMALAWSD